MFKARSGLSSHCILPWQAVPRRHIARSFLLLAFQMSRLSCVNQQLSGRKCAHSLRWMPCCPWITCPGRSLPNFQVDYLKPIVSVTQSNVSEIWLPRSLAVPPKTVVLVPKWNSVALSMVNMKRAYRADCRSVFWDLWNNCWDVVTEGILCTTWFLTKFGRRRVREFGWTNMEVSISTKRPNHNNHTYSTIGVQYAYWNLISVLASLSWDTACTPCFLVLCLRALLSMKQFPLKLNSRVPPLLEWICIRQHLCSVSCEDLQIRANPKARPEKLDTLIGLSATPWRNSPTPLRVCILSYPATGAQWSKWLVDVDLSFWAALRR